MSETTTPPNEIRHYRTLARKIVQHHFGKEASRIVYKRSGLTNYVFSVNHVEGQFMIRISPDPEKLDPFKKELWATQKVREAGVPTPEVLAVGSDIISEPYMIARRVTGVEATHHPKRRNIVHEMGTYAAIINSIRTNNFGNRFDWVGEEVKPNSWADYLEDEWKVEDRLEIMDKHEILPNHSLSNLRRIVEEAKSLNANPSLNHSDLRMKNVIVDDDGQITAIIDWDNCLSTIVPAWELSIALHDLTIDEKQSFIEGYGCSNQQLAQIAPLMKALNMLNYSPAIEDAVKRKDSKALNEFRFRLSGLLDLYSICKE